MARRDAMFDLRPLMPDYTVKEYREGMYKLTKFRLPLYPMPKVDREEEASESDSEGKLSQAYSRARSVVQQLGLCNDWDYFITLTIDKTKWDRYNLEPFYKAFAQWVRDYRKAYCCSIEYMLVPEKHEDGAWHMHGFINGIPEDHLTPFVPGIHPQNLIDKGYLNWGRYSEKFGFCSLGKILDPVACAFYISKYVTKAFDRGVSRYGAHLYYASIGLKRAVRFADIYGQRNALDKLLTDKFEFVSTGWVYESWDFWCDYIVPDEWVVFGNYDIDTSDPRETYVDLTGDFEQLNLFEQMDACIGVLYE